jgi:hypothetical protein
MAAAEPPVATDPPSAAEEAAERRREQLAEQRSRWLEQYLGDGWTEVEPGVYSFDDVSDPSAVSADR